MMSFRQFIREFDLINARRYAGHSYPWTEDKVMQQYRFGNFRRELDRLNRVLILAFEDRVPDATYITDLAVNRMVSQLSFTEDALLRSASGVGLFQDFEKLYLERRKAGLPCRPNSFMSCRSDKDFLLTVKRCYERVYEYNEAIEDSPTLKTVYRLFAPVVGKFTSWQLALDFLMLRYVHNNDEFFHLGPGSAVALQNLQVPGGASALPGLLKLINANPAQLPITIEELEGALCEYSKYVRLNNWAFPGKFRHYIPSFEILPEVPTDIKLKEFYANDKEKSS
jgi:hypothetical protein